MIKEETIRYEISGKSFVGSYFYEDSTPVKRPVVIVAHAWRGLDAFAKQKAKELAILGYVGFAADLYGDAKNVTTNEEAQALMVPLFLDRKELRSRIVAAFNTAKALDVADASNIAAIGFCFGGLTVIELLRSGVDIKGVATFHALLGHSMGTLHAAKHPETHKMKGALLILHGHDDPLESAEDIREIQTEMTEGGVDWEMDIYGHTKHAFTNPEATDKGSPLLYNKLAAERSWQRARNFLENLF